MLAPTVSRTAIKVATVESKLGRYEAAVEHFRTAAESLEAPQDAKNSARCGPEIARMWSELRVIKKNLKKDKNT